MLELMSYRLAFSCMGVIMLCMVIVSIRWAAAFFVELYHKWYDRRHDDHGHNNDNAVIG